MASLNALQWQIHETAKAKGWWTMYRSPGDLLMLVTSELAEALEEVRNGHPVDEIYFGEDGKPEGYPIELADAMIRILDMFGDLGLDAEKVIQMKVDYNEGRAYRHGGKAL